MKQVIFLLSLFSLMNLNAGNLSKPQSGKIEIPSIFSDNMVLQRNADVSFWGKAEPNTEININATWGESANTTVNTDGAWMTKIKTPDAGGPFDVTLQVGDSVITYKNVLIGEVWLCSGQSNMEMPVQGFLTDPILNSKEEIEKANYPDIRLFTVARAISNKKEFNCQGEWEECTPKTVATFSATAYFFGKKLYDELHIPIGLIHSSWGGTPVEAWTGAKFLEKEKDFQKILEDIKNSGPAIEKYNKWLYTHPVIDVSKKESDEKWMNLDFNDSECSEINYPDSNWKVMNLPRLWESSEVGDFDGVVWFRKEIQIPESWIGKNLVLELGPIDDMDRTFVNGSLVGSQEKEGFYNVDRVYNIPKDDVLPNKLVIAVRVVDNQGGGGIYGRKEKLKIYPSGSSNEKISLASEWKYLPVAEYIEQKFYVFGANGNDFSKRPLVKIGLSANTPTLLFNAMINPLIPYSIKGVIWYQGEANTDNPEEYATLFPLMIENWRERWHNQFPFYYVQIAPYNYGDQTHSEKLREVQLNSLSVPNTGMAVTLDIGSPKTIHPGDKEDVGDRLARWALAKDYSVDIPYSGPLYKSMKVEEDKIILSFNYAESGLVLKERDGENNFLIAGKDKVFRKATVKIDNDKLIISNEQIKNPVAVRYCFTNTSEATLFNEDNLPASSFRTDNWNE